MVKLCIHSNMTAFKCLSGSRDSQLGLWRIDGFDDIGISPLNSLQVPEYSIKSPVSVKECANAWKIRALAFNDNKKVM